MFWKPGVSIVGDYFTKHHSPEYYKGMITVYFRCPNGGQDYARVRYSKCTPNSTRNKPITTGDYNNTYTRSGVYTKSRKGVNKDHYKTLPAKVQQR